MTAGEIPTPLSVTFLQPENLPTCFPTNTSKSTESVIKRG